MEKKDNKIVYVEPSDYFPKDIRKKYGLGEFDPEYLAEQKAKKKKAGKKTNNKKRKALIRC